MKYTYIYPFTFKELMIQCIYIITIQLNMYLYYLDKKFLIKYHKCYNRLHKLTTL